LIFHHGEALAGPDRDAEAIAAYDKAPLLTEGGQLPMLATLGISPGRGRAAGAETKLTGTRRTQAR